MVVPLRPNSTMLREPVGELYAPGGYTRKRFNRRSSTKPVLDNPQVVTFGKRAPLVRTLCILALASAAGAASRNDWPQWRGPHADSVAAEARLPVAWSVTKNIRWSVTLPGWGTSSPVIYGDRLFVTSQLVEGGSKSLLTLCLNRNTGEELWRHDFGLGVDQRTNPKSNLAVNTPAVTADCISFTICSMS